MPRYGFPYFYCGWGGGGGNDDGGGGEGGYVQLIENEDDGDYDDARRGGDDAGEPSAGGGTRGVGGSKRFPRDFGIDVIGGMMGCDPMRFQRKTPAQDGDRVEILRFCAMWKDFDWTLELDG